MITIKLDGLDSLKASLGALPRNVQAATKRALINTALSVRDAEQEEMKRVFDRPTRWTIGSIRVKALDSMSVVVGVVDPDGFYKRANYYLGTQIAGGPRGLKAMEKALQHYGLMPSGWVAVPGAGAKLDSFGNMGPGQIRQILSWFGAAERWAGSTQNMTKETRDRRRKGTKTKRGFEYLAIKPDNKRGKLMPGIYMRTYFGFGSSIKPVLMFVRAARYKARFDMERVAKHTIGQVWRHKFESAMRQAGSA